MAIAVAADGVELVQTWDKTFPRSDKVEHAQATFKNRFGITLAADVYKPKGATGRLAAIAVSGPFGRSVLHGGVGWHTALCCFARHQHGGFSGGGGLSHLAR